MVIIIQLYKIAIRHHGMQSFHIIVLHACLLLQNHYVSMQINAMPIDSMFSMGMNWCSKTFDNYQLSNIAQ